MALLHVNYFSDVLGMSMNMDVILPQQTKNQIGMDGVAKEGKIQTLYLLHGMSDDHTIWQRRTSIERYASELGIAVVMPNVHLSWYTNMKHGLNYWTHISEELPEICRGFFPQMSDKREDNFAAGLSMGGYGAMKLGLCAPDRFGAVAALSGGFMIDVIGDDLNNPVWQNIFGDVKKVKGTDSDLFFMAEQLKAEGRQMPDIYMWCGTEDFLYKHNTAMRDHLKALGYNLTYEESPGDHQWKYWDEKIQTVLGWLPIK